MKTATVTLNGQSTAIEELRSRDNAAWRARLESEFDSLAKLIEAAPETDITNTRDLAHLVRSVSGMLLGSVDRLKALLGEYAPALKPTLDDAYDSEILEAFVEVLKLAYPFGVMLEKVSGLIELGRARRPTGPS